MKIYVFGNPLVKEDSIPLTLMKALEQKFPKIDFQVVDPNENFPPEGEKDLVIFDTVQGLKVPSIIHFEDLEGIGSTPVSPHDYDLLFHLMLLKKLKKINNVTIIGIPQNNYHNILTDIIFIISKLRV